MDNAGLTSDQQSTLSLFQEVTANSRDAQGAIQLLKSCDWNTERALELHWASADELPSAGGAGVGSAIGGGGGDGASLSRGPLADPLIPSGSSAGGSGNAFVGWLTRSLRFIGSTVLGVLRYVILGPARGPLLGGGGSSGAAFRRSLANTYTGGNATMQLPQFFEGTFGQALSAARTETKLLVVYLHSEHSRSTETFINQILANEYVRQTLDENFVVWAGDIARREAHQVSLMIHARQYPYFCVLLPATREELRVIGSLPGNTEADGAIALLTRCMEEMEFHRAEIVAHREQQAEDRSLREQQDVEYQQALELDRKREEEKKAQELVEREALKREEDERKRQEEAAVAAEAKRQEIVEKRKRKAAMMDNEEADATARISLRLPAGQRITRKFRQTAPLSEVYAWAECCPFLSEYQDRNLEIPARFTLKTSFPSRDLTDMDKSVEELQLSGSNILVAGIDDDED